MIKIIGEGFPKDDEILMDEIKVVYVQNADNCSNQDDIQELTIITKDGGGGKYLNLKTNENGWSINSEDDIIELIKNFKSIYENTNIG